MTDIPHIQPALPGLMTETPAPSFAEAMAMIETWTDLSDTRRRDLASALRSAARIAERALGNITCSTEILNGLLFNRPAAAFRIGQKRYATILSGVRFVLRRIGRHAPFQRGESMLSDAWSTFLSPLAEGPMRAGMRNLARWCDARGIAPEAVTAEVFADFLVDDRVARLSAATDDQGPSLARAWNVAILRQPEGERFTRLAAPRKREPYTFPFEAYPLTFQDDVEAFRAKVTRVDRNLIQTDPSGSVPGQPARRFLVPGHGPFTSKQAPFRKLKKSSVDSRVFCIRQAAAALHRTGTPFAQITSLRDLVFPLDHASRILQFHLDRIDREHGGQLAQIAEVLRQIAKYHVEVPAECLETITAWGRDTAERRRGEMGPKARKCLLAMIQKRPRAMLLALPGEIRRRAISADLPPIERALANRKALVIDLLTSCPARIGNIQGLRIDRSFARLNGPRLPSHLLVDGDDVKNEEPIQWPLPPELARSIQAYLDDHRPQLAEAGNPFLFAGRGEKPLSLSAIRAGFQRSIDRIIGIEVYPHAMRHFAAWLFLKNHPGQYEMARRILGHRDVKTTISFYCGLEADAAAMLLDEAITQERKGGRMLARAGFRRGGMAGPPKAGPKAPAGKKGR